MTGIPIAFSCRTASPCLSPTCWAPVTLRTWLPKRSLWSTNRHTYGTSHFRGQGVTRLVLLSSEIVQSATRPPRIPLLRHQAEIHGASEGEGSASSRPWSLQINTRVILKDMRCLDAHTT